MSITEYFCNHERMPLKNTSFPDSFGKFFVFLYLTNKNIVYLLVKFGKWME